MLVPQGVANLLVAGRCASMTHEGQSAARASGGCFVMGQAAGTAAAMPGPANFFRHRRKAAAAVTHAGRRVFRQQQRRRRSLKPPRDWIPTMDMTPPPTHGKPAAPNGAARKAFYDAISAHSMTPLWEVLHALVPQSPSTPCKPALWKYAEVRPFLMQSGELITAEEAVRRVLILENPGLRGQSCITQSLYAGLQVILPGEDRAQPPPHAKRAALHRRRQRRLHRRRRRAHHRCGPATSSSRRAGPGTTTATKAAESDTPVVWLDGLDIPMLRFFDAGFAENGGAKLAGSHQARGHQLRTASAHNMAAGAHDAPFGADLADLQLPLRPHAARPCTSWNACRHRRLGRRQAALRQPGSPAAGPCRPWHLHAAPAGRLSPARAGARPTAPCTAWSRAGKWTSSATASGAFEFGPRDHFVIPSWHTARLRSAQGCVLFSFSDRPVHQALGIHREERLS
jgi:gentisate 1,2-dioxygenase